MSTEKNPAAQSLGRLRWVNATDAEKTAFASAGGKARAAKLSAQSRKDIARKAAKASVKARRAKAKIRKLADQQEQKTA